MTICDIGTTPTGHIYFLRALDGVIKIGFSSCLSERMAAHKRHYGHDARLLFAVPGCEHRERAFHAHFKCFRIGSGTARRPKFRSAPEHFRIPDGVLEEARGALRLEDGFTEDAGRPPATCCFKVSREMHLVLKTIANRTGMTLQDIFAEAVSQYVDQIDPKIKTPYRRKVAA